MYFRKIVISKKYSCYIKKNCNSSFKGKFVVCYRDKLNQTDFQNSFTHYNKNVVPKMLLEFSRDYTYLKIDASYWQRTTCKRTRCYHSQKYLSIEKPNKMQLWSRFKFIRIKFRIEKLLITKKFSVDIEI